MAQDRPGTLPEHAQEMLADAGGISPVERTRERSMALCCALDLAILLPMLTASIWSNSLTLMGETLRGVGAWICRKLSKIRGLAQIAA